MIIRELKPAKSKAQELEKQTSWTVREANAARKFRVKASLSKPASDRHSLQPSVISSRINFPTSNSSNGALLTGGNINSGFMNSVLRFITIPHEIERWVLFQRSARFHWLCPMVSPSPHSLWRITTGDRRYPVGFAHSLATSEWLMVDDYASSRELAQ